MNADEDFNAGFWGNSNLVNITDLCDQATMNDSVDAVSQLAPLGKIKIPQNKEIHITLSAQIDILTVNQATSKKQTTSYWGNIGGTTASAGVTVEVFAQPVGEDTLIKCDPGRVTMASRAVELKNVIGGNVTYEDCSTEDDVFTCEQKIADVELASSIGLAMSTAAAHTFQWLCIDMVADTYDVIAKFTLDAEVGDICSEFFGGDCTDIADFAAGRVALNKRIMTVQEVRMVNHLDLS